MTNEDLKRRAMDRAMEVIGSSDTKTEAFAMGYQDGHRSRQAEVDAAKRERKLSHSYEKFVALMDERDELKATLDRYTHPDNLRKFADEYLTLQVDELKAEVERLKGEARKWSDHAVEMSKHRDAWRMHAYGRRAAPESNFLGSVRRDKPTEVERMRPVFEAAMAAWRAEQKMEDLMPGTIEHKAAAQAWVPLAEAFDEACDEADRQADEGGSDA